jgi:hypothetical protein
MKRFTTLFLSTFLAISLLFGGTMSVLASAEEEISSVSPRLSNCVAATFHFGIVDGNLCAGVTYNGYSNMFTDAKLTLSFEKKYMLFFWKTVEIGYPDEKWTGYCYDLDGSIYQEFPCPGSGTYRANFKFEVYGRYSSVVDVIEDYVQREC